MNRRYFIVLILPITLFIHSCKPYSPSVYRGLPKEYTSAWLEKYGQCYDSIPYEVFALDLYSEGLELDSSHTIQGTGYNLYLSDIFVPDSILATGTYTSLKIEQGHASVVPFTFLPGREWEGRPSGMYLLNIEEGKISSIQVLDSGVMVVSEAANEMTDLQFTLYYKNQYGYKATYSTHFQGALMSWPQK